LWNTGEVYTVELYAQVRRAVRELLGKGVSVHAYRDLPLMMADHNGHTETVKVLKNWKRRGKTKHAFGSQTA
jgi:hypothetical protein